MAHVALQSRMWERCGFAGVQGAERRTAGGFTSKLAASSRRAVPPPPHHAAFVDAHSKTDGGHHDVEVALAPPLLHLQVSKKQRWLGVRPSVLPMAAACRTRRPPARRRFRGAGSPARAAGCPCRRDRPPPRGPPPAADAAAEGADARVGEGGHPAAATTCAQRRQQAQPKRPAPASRRPVARPPASRRWRAGGSRLCRTGQRGEPAGPAGPVGWVGGWVNHTWMQQRLREPSPPQAPAPSAQPASAHLHRRVAPPIPQQLLVPDLQGRGDG